MKRSPLKRKTRLKRKPKHLGPKTYWQNRYEELNEMQNKAKGWPAGTEKCATCETPRKEGGRRLHIDHDHKTGAIRGLVCFRCNKLMPYYATGPLLHACGNHIDEPPLRLVDERKAA